PRGASPFGRRCTHRAEPDRRTHRDQHPAAERGGEMSSLRIVIAEDSAILRDGLAGLLAERGHEVVAMVGDASTLSDVVGRHNPDVVVVDVRMPPSFTDEGLLAAIELRRKYPLTGV